MRGAVYLKDREGQVAFVADPVKGAAPEVQWVGGTVAASQQQITVTTVLGDQTYRLMDHITVSIC